MDLFNGMEVQYKLSDDTLKTRPIPLRYSSREKSRIFSEADHNKMISGNLNMLPRASLSLVSMSKSTERQTNKNIKNSIVHRTGQNSEFVFNSVPYEFTYDVTVQCRGMNEATQIIEQVVPTFNPTYDIDIWETQYLDEPTRVPVRLVDVLFDSDDYDEYSVNIVNITFNISLIGNIYPPVKNAPRIEEWQIRTNNMPDMQSYQFVQGWDKNQNAITYDTVPPNITLNGNSVMSLNEGTAYVEPGATARDAVDGDISGNIVISGTVDENAPGSYDIVYTVYDAAGNMATETRTVNVIQDAIAPVVTLIGPSVVSIDEGTTYTEQGATAADNLDGDISGNIVITGSVDVNTVGEYTLAYTATDSRGNSSFVTRTVNVLYVDTVAPVITLLGDTNMSVDQGTSYIEPGATALDNNDGDISGDIIISGTVDVNTVGSYNITYTVEDAAGNSTSVTRIVTVSQPVLNEYYDVMSIQFKGYDAGQQTIEVYYDLTTDPDMNTYNGYYSSDTQRIRSLVGTEIRGVNSHPNALPNGTIIEDVYWVDAGQQNATLRLSNGLQEAVNSTELQNVVNILQHPIADPRLDYYPDFWGATASRSKIIDDIANSHFKFGFMTGDNSGPGFKFSQAGEIEIELTSGYDIRVTVNGTVNNINLNFSANSHVAVEINAPTNGYIIYVNGEQSASGTLNGTFASSASTTSGFGGGGVAFNIKLESLNSTFTDVYYFADDNDSTLVDQYGGESLTLDNGISWYTTP